MLVFTLLFDTLFTPNYSSEYFTSKPFEQEGSIYRWFGVKFYISILKLIGWEKIIRKGQPIKNNLESLTKFEFWTKGSETVHLFSAIFVTAVTIWIAWRYSFSHIKWLVLSNVLLNVYPVLLQRYNRPRINRLIRRQEKYTNKTQQTNSDNK
jgi:hypothetical protein